MNRFPIVRIARNIGFGFLCVLLLVGGYFTVLRLTGNFATVVDGEFYRSGQMNARQLADHVKNYGIRTIINLRGSNAGRPWYDAEVAEARQLGVGHIDFGISARRELTEPKATTLISLMMSAPKPILIHCNWGADRSGLASALYLAAIKKSDFTLAEKQLSIRFGHIPLSFIPEHAMDQTLANFKSREISEVK